MAKVVHGAVAPPERARGRQLAMLTIILHRGDDLQCASVPSMVPSNAFSTKRRCKALHLRCDSGLRPFFAAVEQTS